MPNRCILCKVEAETVHHIFNVCEYARTLYDGVITAINSAESRPKGTTVQAQPMVWYTDTFTSNEHSVRTRSVLLVTQFILWRERGVIIFRESLVEEVINQLKYTDMPAFH